MSLLSYQDARPWAKSIAHARDGRHDAAVACRSVDRRVRQRSPADRRGKGHASAVGGGRRAGRQPRRSAGAASLHRRLDDWPARCGADDAGGLSRFPRAARSRISTSKCRRTSPKTNGCRPSKSGPATARVVHHVIVYSRGARAGARRPRRADPSRAAADAALHVRRRHGHSRRADRRSPRCRPISGSRSDRTIGRRRRCSGRQSAPTCRARPAASTRSTRRCVSSRARRSIFQMHYTTTGKATTDRTQHRPGVREGAVRRPSCASTALINGNLHIPAGDADHRVDATMTINRDVTLWSMLPHTHVRGKRWSYEATYPDGRKETHPVGAASTTSTGRPTTSSSSR